MDNMWWSYILTVVGLAGFILAGRKIWWCWYINIGAQVLWFTYAIVTAQYGFILGALLYSVVFARNAYAWTKEHKHKSYSVTDNAEEGVMGTSLNKTNDEKIRELVRQIEDIVGKDNVTPTVRRQRDGSYERQFYIAYETHNSDIAKSL